MRSILAMVAAAVLWSTGGLFIKVLSMDAVSLAGWRSGVAALALFGLARARGLRLGLPRDRSTWLAAGAYSLILLLFVMATKRTTAANAIFLQYTAPMYVLLLEPLLLGTRFRVRDLGFVALALAGMSLFFMGKLETGNAAGNAMALASGVFFAVFALLVRSRHDDERARWQTVTLGNTILAVGIAGYFAVGHLASRPERFMLPATAGEALAVLFLGTVQIGLAYALFTYAISKLSALEATLLGMLEPILNPVWVFLGTGERPSAWALVGAVLIVASVAVRTWVVSREGPDDVSYEVPTVS
jgi:drug/metabolite transporter, DME family